MLALFVWQTPAYAGDSASDTGSASASATGSASASDTGSASASESGSVSESGSGTVGDVTEESSLSVAELELASSESVAVEGDDKSSGGCAVSTSSGFAATDLAGVLLAIGAVFAARRRRA